MSKKILIADDLMHTCILFKVTLENEGYQVFTAKNRAQAEEIFQEEDLDLLILDINLGKDNGIDFLESVRSTPKGKVIPAIVITASPEVQSVIRAKLQEIEHFLIKPVDLIQLKEKIQEIFTKPPQDPKYHPSQSRKVVLIADPDESYQTLYEKILPSSKFQILKVSNRMEIFSRFKDHAVDLMIIDIAISQMEGMNIIEELLHFNSVLPVLIATSIREKNMIISAGQKGIKNYLIKPLDIQQVRSKIFELLNYTDY